MLNLFEFKLRTRLVFGVGTVEQLGHLAQRFKKPLLPMIAIPTTPARAPKRRAIP